MTATIGAMAGAVMIALCVAWWSARGRAEANRQAWLRELDVSLRAQLKAARMSGRLERSLRQQQALAVELVRLRDEVIAETADADAATAENLAIKSQLQEMRIDLDVYRASILLFAQRLGMDVSEGSVRFEDVDAKLTELFARQVPAVDGVDIR